MLPIILPANQPGNRFYPGARGLGGLITCCHGQDTLGLTRLDNGSLLVDEIQNNPEQWLGPDHIKAFGNNTKILVKLLDAGQRLPVHAHPHRDWAKHHLAAPCGKAEMWYILEPGVMHVGLRESVTPERLRAIVDEQDIETLLGLMHEVPLRRHQSVYIPPGMLHAIVEGMLIAEVQEPSDLSVFCEWRDYPLDGVEDGHLGLGFDVALTAIDLSGKTREEIEALITDHDMDGPLQEHHTGEYFLLERYNVDSSSKFAPGFAVIMVLEGQFQMTTDASEVVPIRKGSTVVVPYGAGEFYLKGNGLVLIARPPHA